MTESLIREDDSTAKANMDAIYEQPDPRAYFRELAKLDYAIPDLAKPVFRRLADALIEDRGPPLQLLDLGCSYGINAALLKYGLSIAELTEHWSGEAAEAAASDAVLDADRRYFVEAGADRTLSIVGLDPSEPAIGYAEEAGLLDVGLALNLEAEPLPRHAATRLAPTDLVMSTGCVGYITDQTFARLLPAVTQGQSPWIANFVLRMFPFDTISEVLADWGYVTEKLEGKRFTQREFLSEAEQASVIERLESLGIDPEGIETEGALHAEFFLSRPAAEATIPVEALLAA